MRVAFSLLVFSVATGLLVGCSENNNPETADYWLPRLEKRPERVEAIKNLARLGDKKAVPAVLKWFKEEGIWQPDAAYALGELKDKTVIKELIAGIDFRAGSGGDDKLARNRVRTNINIVRALAMLGAREGSEPIKRLLATGDDRVRDACLQSLGELGDFANTPVIVEAALSDKEPLVRLAAIRALGDLGDPKAVPALIQLLFFEMQNARFYEPARYALVQIGAAAIPELQKTLRRENATVEALRMPDGSKIADGAVEAKAASVLGSLGAREASPAIAAALATMYAKAKKGPKDAPVPAYFAVVELAYALGSVGGPQAAKALLTIAKDKDANLRLAACESLTALGDNSVVPELINAAKSGDGAARSAALVAASRLGAASDLAAFDSLRKAGDAETPNEAMDEAVTNERVRIVAAKDCAKDLACWRKKLGDANAKVRERAAYELGWLDAKVGVPDLQKAAEDVDAEVRMAAVLSLERLGGADAVKLQAIFDKDENSDAYMGVNQELLRLIARAKSEAKKK